MMTEHDRDGELLADLRRLTSGYQTPADGCASYHALYEGLAQLEADTHLHIHKENNVLFPLVTTMEAALA
jgi:regulator of cell morphogenesis and NO signaling